MSRNQKPEHTIIIIIIQRTLVQMNWNIVVSLVNVISVDISSIFGYYTAYRIEF